MGMTPTPAPALPPLPEPSLMSSDTQNVYTADQMQAYALAALAAQPHGAMPKRWTVQIMEDWKPRRLRLTIGVQSFDLDVHDDPEEPGRMEWYRDQLTKAMLASAPQPSVDLAACDRGGVTQPLTDKRLWLWKNFVDGRPEYWAFDNAYPIHLEHGDPQTLGEPCGYAIFKPSRTGRTDVSEEQVLRAIARANKTKD